MKIAMKVLNSSLCAGVLLLSSASFAAEPINGFRNYSFGTTFDEINSRLTLSEQETNDQNETVFSASEKVAVGSHDYDLSFWFRDEALIQINLSRSYDASSTFCIGDFDETFGAINARYGPADSPPNKIDPLIMTADFTDANGSSIKLLGASFDELEKCFIHVAYRSGGSGGTF